MPQKNNIPEQKKGASTDLKADKTFDSAHEAANFFHIAKSRLLDISNWDKICGVASAKFLLTDKYGNPAKRLPKVGDHFQIDIPAPGSSTGDGHDWVKIEELENTSVQAMDEEIVSITVRPATNPQNKKSDTAHFFKEDATSTFLVKRKENIVTAEVHGRNELPNTDADGIFDTIRNAVVALGAMAGISTPQWKSLVNGLLDTENQ